MMNQLKIFLLLSLCAVMLLNKTIAAAPSCNYSASLIQKSKYRAEAGFTPVNNSITEIYAEAGCNPVDVYVWAVQNNKSGKFNEVDLGVGYSHSANDLTYRIVYERWEYPESTGHNNVAIGLLAYSGWPVKVRVKWTYVNEDSGQLYSIVLTKPFVINKSEQSSLKLVTALRINCVDNYFGATDCPSNIVYSGKLIAKDNEFTYGLIVDVHDGQGNFNDTTNLGLLFAMDF